MVALRFCTWNVETLLPLLGIVSPRAHRRSTHLVEVMQELSWPDVLCLQEVRIRPRDVEHVAAMETALPGYVCQHALCIDPQNGKFRGGRTYGVATYVRAQLEPLPIARPSWEREGRVCALELQGPGLFIANVYAVNGTDRAHFDHDLGGVSGTRNDFKRRFQADFITFVRSVSSADARVLLGDWNVSRSTLDIWPRFRDELPHALARAMFNDTLMPALDALDAFRELYPEARAYTWFNRLAPPGRLDAARVDYPLVSRALMPAVQDVRIHDEPSARHHSDHAPVELVLRA